MRRHSPDIRRLWPVPAAVLLLGVAACTWQGLRQHDEGPRRLYVAGELSHVSDRAVVEAARPHLGADFFDLDLDAIRDAVAAEPWLAVVQVHRRWPDGLVIRVREHRPVALWGEDAVLAADGSLFVPRGARPDGLPRLSGPEGSQARLRARLPELREILAPAGHGIAALDLDPRGAWRLELDNGLELRLGRTDIETRVRRFVEHAAPALGERLQRAAYVDMRYGDGFAVGRGGDRRSTASPRRAPEGPDGMRDTDTDRESENEQAA